LKRSPAFRGRVINSTLASGNHSAAATVRHESSPARSSGRSLALQQDPFAFGVRLRLMTGLRLSSAGDPAVKDPQVGDGTDSDSPTHRTIRRNRAMSGAPSCAKSTSIYGQFRVGSLVDPITGSHASQYSPRPLDPLVFRSICSQRPGSHRERANAKLSEMLAISHERRAAHRPCPAEIVRCVGPIPTIVPSPTCGSLSLPGSRRTTGGSPVTHGVRTKGKGVLLKCQTFARSIAAGELSWRTVARRN